MPDHARKATRLGPLGKDKTGACSVYGRGWRRYRENERQEDRHCRVKQTF